MKRLPVIAIGIAAIAFAVTPLRASAQAAPRAIPQAAVPPAPGADTDVEIHFSDGRQYVGGALVERPKQIVIAPSGKGTTTTFINGKPPRGPYELVPDGAGKITYADGGTLQATFANGLANGDGAYQTPGGFSFKGVFRDGKPVSGAATYPNGSAYSGAFSDGFPSGQGTLTSTGRVTRAEGTWTKGVLSDGTVTFSDGARYIGPLDANGKVNGPGRFELPDGAVLTGSFIDGLYAGRLTERWSHDAGGAHLARRVLTVDVLPAGPAFSGPAKMTFGDGNALVGKVSDGEFNGPGAYVYGDGTAFHGTLVGGRFSGPIAWTNGRGTSILGAVRHGRMEGPAVLTRPNGKTVRGAINDDGVFYTFTGPVDERSRPNGHGTYGYPDGETMTGRWSHGRLVGPIVDRLTDGTIFYVSVLSPSYDLMGPARVVLPNGDVATGRLDREGDLEGPGSYRRAHIGDVLTGHWVDGAFHGDF